VKIWFERITGNIPGAYVSVESEIIRYIKYNVNPETDTMVMDYHENIWFPNAGRILTTFITYLVQIKAFLYDQYDRFRDPHIGPRLRLGLIWVEG
jgi:hypothetical protein